MYPPRSSNRQDQQRSKKRRRKTAWAWMINGTLLALITALLAYHFIGTGKEGASPPEPAVSAAPTDSSATGESPPPEEPAVTAPPSPSSEVSPSPTPTPAETPEPEPSATATPEPTLEPAATGGAGTGSGTPGDTVTLNFAGDVIFAGKVGELLQKQGYDYPFSALGGMFKQDDLTVVNLETPVTTGGVSAENKQFVFKSAPQALDALKAAGVDAVNLANNHSLDMGTEGLLDTLGHLDQRGIPHVGAGRNAKEAYTAQHFERKGIKIALLGFTRVIPHSDWVAGANQPGVASVYDNREALKAIAREKASNDLVIVIVHWGKERVEQYDGIQQELGRSFIDAGADLVIGGHPHVLQGIEPYKGKWIAYSTGNFIFTRSTVPATWETAVFTAQCGVSGDCSLKLTPMNAELGRPVPMDAEDGRQLLTKVQALSGGLVNIRTDGSVVRAK